MTFVQFMLLSVIALLLAETLEWMRLLRRRVQGTERRSELVAAIAGLFAIPLAAYAVYLMADSPFSNTLSSPLLLCA